MADEDRSSTKRFKTEPAETDSTENQLKKLQAELAKKESLLKEKEARIEQLERNNKDDKDGHANVDAGHAAWTEHEHEQFLSALEAHGGDGDVDSAWGAIAQAVQTRNVEEVKLHAHEYFFKLQNERTTTSSGGQPGGSGAPGQANTGQNETDDGWTPEDVATFEQGLAAFEESLPDRGGRLQQLLPHKNQAEIMKRYQKLLMQITSIESGAIPIYRGNEFYIRCRPARCRSARSSP